MGRLVIDDRKATVSQITTRYNQGIQNTISERTTGGRTLTNRWGKRPLRAPGIQGAPSDIRETYLANAPVCIFVMDGVKC